jgi:NAD+ kinase
MRRVGFVVNPIAGMGGRVGLKGTDDKVEQARELGAEQRAPDRARETLAVLRDANAEIDLVTVGDPMGAMLAREAGFEPTVVGSPDSKTTSAEDTRAAVRASLEQDVDIVVFVGGDGTAVDVAETIESAGMDTPILGVPAGVKVYSAVFAVDPRAAGQIVVTYEDTERAEVNDIDEAAYRDGEVRSQLRALARVPVAQQRQSSKQVGGGSVDGVAEGFVDAVESGVTYVLGPGGTVGQIKSALGFSGTPLGVDLYRDGDMLVTDAAESEILDNLGERTVIVVSPIGGQGFIFGRGNHQISPDVIRQSDIEIVASRRKANDLGVLRVDTGDRELDESLRGWQRVRIGRFETRLMEVV